MKLELKHLAPYLPYDLGISRYNNIDKEFKKSHIMTASGGYDKWGIDSVLKGKTIHGSDLKPILRPLSDLTKEEFKKQLSFGMIYDENTWFEGFEDGRLTIGSTTINACVNRNVYYQDFLVLFENHFDVFGLIESGLAIDINTL